MYSVLYWQLAKTRTVLSKQMIHPRRHNFSKRDPFITVYTYAVIREMKVYLRIGTLWTVISFLYKSKKNGSTY